MESNTQKQAIDILSKGGVGVMPTDTVYGLVARAADKQAVGRFYSLKKREHKPGTVIAANIEQLATLGVDEQTLRAAKHLWPNPLSLIVSADEDLSYIHLGLDSLAVRIPKDTALQSLLEHTGPLVTSSANQPGLPEATTILEAQDYFGDKVDFYVDAGDLSDRAPSTIARFTDDGQLEVVRQGAFKLT